MKGISIQPGVVLIELRGAFMLASTRKARERCPYVLGISSTGAYLWKMLKEGYSFEKILASFRNRYEIDDPDRLELDIRACISQLKERGYLYYMDMGGTDFD